MLRPTLASLSLPFSDISAKKPIIIHHLNDLTLGGTEKMVQIHLSQFVKDGVFDHYLAYRLQGRQGPRKIF